MLFVIKSRRNSISRLRLASVKSTPLCKDQKLVPLGKEGFFEFAEVARAGWTHDPLTKSAHSFTKQADREVVEKKNV